MTKKFDSIIDPKTMKKIYTHLAQKGDEVIEKRKMLEEYNKNIHDDFLLQLLTDIITDEIMQKLSLENTQNSYKETFDNEVQSNERYKEELPNKIKQSKETTDVFNKLDDTRNDTSVFNDFTTFFIDSTLTRLILGGQEGKLPCSSFYLL